MRVCLRAGECARARVRSLLARAGGIAPYRGSHDGHELPGQEEPRIVFQRPAPQPGSKSTLANFRTGDIAVLYPGNQHPLRNQLFKCIILSIDQEKVEVKLRSRVFNQSVFDQFPNWTLEPDLIDSRFLIDQMQSIFTHAAVWKP